MFRHALPVAALALTSIALTAAADHGRGNQRIAAQLKPTEEVPALSSVARGRFKATIDEANQTISYELSYDGLEAPPLQAHIHIGQRAVNGRISVFLCGNPPAGVPEPPAPPPPACPPSPATITGVLTPANIIGPVEQGIEPTTDTVNEFDELVDLLRRGVTYANVHTSKFPGGEIRGQIRDHRK